MAILKRFIPNFLKKKIKDEINKNYLFSGWNMQTNTCPPWKYINKNEINNSQIPYFTDIQKDITDIESSVDDDISLEKDVSNITGTKKKDE